MMIPFQIYDFLAVLFPAVLITTIIHSEFPVAFQQATVSGNYGGVAVSLVMLYLLGQATMIACLWVRKCRWVKDLLEKRRSASSDEVELRAQDTTIVLPKEMAHAILADVRKIYGLQIYEKDWELFGLVYGPVHDQIPKRDVFLSLANLMLAVTFICAALVLISVLQSIIWHRIDYLWTAAPSFVGMFLFREGYNTNINLAEMMPFTAFLSWSKTR